MNKYEIGFVKIIKPAEGLTVGKNYPVLMTLAHDQILNDAGKLDEIPVGHEFLGSVAFYTMHTEGTEGFYRAMARAKEDFCNAMHIYYSKGE